MYSQQIVVVHCDLQLEDFLLPFVALAGFEPRSSHPEEDVTSTVTRCHAGRPDEFAKNSPKV
jgi:hypothetical protein